MKGVSVTKWAGVAALALVFGIAGAASAQEVHVVNWGGAQMKGHKAAFFGPFTEKTGIKVVPDTWNGKISKIRAQVESGVIVGDLYPANPQDAIAGCDEGLLEELPPSRIGLSDADVKDFHPGALETCGASTDIWSYIWSWNTDRHPEWTDKTGPQKIGDIFNMKKWPGVRGMGKRAYITFEYALQADGVPNDQIYEVLKSDAGVKRALDKLGVIKDNNVWWVSTPQQAQLLADGETDLQMIVGARWYNARFNEGKKFHPMWHGQVYSYNMWIVPKGTPRIDQAIAYLKFVMQPKPQGVQAELVGYAPARKSGLDFVSEERRPWMPTAHFDQNAMLMDGVFWADHLDSYTKRFEVWLQK
jgi:putative spermidine/putrescine transport system substrate-binding protein